MESLAKWEHVVRGLSADYELKRVSGLKGGVSAIVTKLDVVDAGGEEWAFIVRQHGAADLARDPDIAEHELQLLTLLKCCGLPLPEPYIAVTACPIIGSPYIVMEYVEGSPVLHLQDFELLGNGGGGMSETMSSADLPSAANTDLPHEPNTSLSFANKADLAQVAGTALPKAAAACIYQAAETLARLHQVTFEPKPLLFLSRHEDAISSKLAQRPREEQLDETLNEGEIRDLLEPVWPLSARNPDVILHGDFWPGNLLWHEGRLTAVIDWEDAVLGDPLSDLGNARLEFLWAFGPEAMEVFTSRYRSIQQSLDYAGLPYWDLCAALRPASQLSNWGLEPAVEQAMRDKHRQFVRQAIQSMGRSL